jgi:precorrin-2/cobalt-factor-2 C20-methyltransferase
VMGQDCAFITIGDPLLYGTFIYVLDKLKARYPQIEVEVIPGISSINAAAAAAVMPLSCRNDRIAILAAEDDDLFIQQTLAQFDTVIFLKVNLIFDRIIAILKSSGWEDRAVFIRRCSTPDQEIIRDIRTLENQKLDYFSILIIRNKGC